jgi:hypothetical protein
MTVVHVFFSDGAVTSYTFENKRAVFAFLDAIRAHDEEELGNGNMIASGDERERTRARNVARRIGASQVVVRHVVRAGPA